MLNREQSILTFVNNAAHTIAELERKLSDVEAVLTAIAAIDKSKLDILTTAQLTGAQEELTTYRNGVKSSMAYKFLQEYKKAV